MTVGRPRVPLSVIGRMRRLRADGNSYSVIARLVGLGRSTVIKYANDVVPLEATHGNMVINPDRVETRV